MIDQLGLCDDGNSIEKCSRHAAAIDTLMEIARALAAPSDIQEILEQLTTQVSRRLNPKVWSLLLKDENAGELELTAEVKASGRNGVRVAGCSSTGSGQGR
jgi:hypothetical protein